MNSSEISKFYKQRWEIVFLSRHQFGPKMSNASIAKYLHISSTTVQRYLSRYDTTGSVEDAPRLGRKRSTSEIHDQTMVTLATGPKHLTSEQISAELAKKSVNVSSRTVRNRLAENTLYYGKTTQKPLLTESHQVKRFEYATNNIDRDWSRIIFTDETTIRLYYHVDRVWKRRGEQVVVRTVKYPLKVNIWGCFSERGFGKLVVINGNLNAEKMVDVYRRGLLPSALKFYGAKTSSWELAEDNDPKHRSVLAKEWKSKNKVRVIDWPSQSPDLNPIENAWALLKMRLRRKKYTTRKGLIQGVFREWNSLSKTYAEKLIASCGKRCQAVIDNNGDWTPY